MPSPPDAAARPAPVAVTAGHDPASAGRRGWSAVWPRVLTALVIGGGWQLLASRGGSEVPGPVPVVGRLWADLTTGTLGGAIGTTLGRATVGFLAAVLVGLVVGAAVAVSRSLRAGIGGLLAAVQTVPSVAWFPVTLVLLAPSEGAILAVVVLGAAPAVAMGLLTGVDRIPPVLHRAGHVLGARGFDRLRHVVLPGALPGLVGGLTQGWAFAWRALMAGELLVALDSPSLGTTLQRAQSSDDATGLFAAMVVVVAIGLLVDEVLLRRVDHAVQRRWGLRP